jgi:hypothetical protein
MTQQDMNASLRSYPKNLRHGMPLWAETHVHVGFEESGGLVAGDKGMPLWAETHVHVGFPMPTAGAARFWDRL